MRAVEAETTMEKKLHVKHDTKEYKVGHRIQGFDFGYSKEEQRALQAEAESKYGERSAH